MKKVIILIVSIITILIISVIVLFTKISNETAEQKNVIPYDMPSSTDNGISERKKLESTEDLGICPRNIQEAYEKYEGPVTLKNLEINLYNLVSKHMPRIYDEIKSYGNKEESTENQLNESNQNDENNQADETYNQNINDKLGEYYDQNKEEIDGINIYSKDEFILICNEILNNLTEQNKQELPVSEVELTTCKDTVENYSFELILNYSNTKKMRLKVILSKNEEKIEYQKYDELKEIFLKYNGPVTKQEITTQLNTLAINAKTIYNTCKDLSLNKIMQYYDLNKEKLIITGIPDAKNYLNLTNQIVRVHWPEKPEYISYTADAETIKTDSSYTTFNANINYSTEDSIKVVVNIINSEDSVNEKNPKIKITVESENE